MGAQLRAVRRRIGTVKSTAKITRAQELIASSRILKAQQRVQAAGPYAREITDAVEAVVSRSSNVEHPLTTEPERATRAAVLILTSDRGFCGGFNASVLREAQGLGALLAERGIEPVRYVSGPGSAPDRHSTSGWPWKRTSSSLSWCAPRYTSVGSSNTPSARSVVLWSRWSSSRRARLRSSASLSMASLLIRESNE